MSDVCGFRNLRHEIGMFLCVWLSAGRTKHIVLFPTTSRVFPVQRARVCATFFFHHTGPYMERRAHEPRALRAPGCGNRQPRTTQPDSISAECSRQEACKRAPPSLLDQTNTQASVVGRLKSSQSSGTAQYGVWTRDEGGLSEWLDSDPDRRQPKQRTLTRRAPAVSRKRGRPADPSSKRQLELTERARLLEEDPAARAERYWEEQAAACAVESARRLKIMRLHRHGAATGGSAGVVMTLRRRRVFEGGW